MNYLKIVYPQIAMGASHKRPLLPECCIKLHEASVTWDIFSANDDDRAEYWEIDMAKYDAQLNGTILTAAEVETAVYGIGGKAAWVSANPHI